MVSPTPLVRYQYNDHLGSATLETNEQAELISYEEYHPFGTTAYSTYVNSSYSTKRYRFSNKERDDETGLYYFGVRYYAAWLGRWTSSDPADFIDGLNLYRYVRNNPVNLVDADGRSSDPPDEDETVVDPIPDCPDKENCSSCPDDNGTNNEGDISENGEYIYNCGEYCSNDDGWIKTSTFIEKEYSSKPYEWASYLEKKGGREIREIFEELGNQKDGLSASQLYTIAIGEGFYFAHLKSNGYDLDNKVDGFMALGIDTFSTSVDRLKASGLLPKDFNEGDEYKVSWNINEEGKTVYSAIFKDVESSLIAFTAVANNRKRLVLQDGKKLGYEEPSEDQILFWTYTYFQGQGRGFKALEKNGSWDISDLEVAGEKIDTKSKYPTSVRSIAYKRLVSWRYIKLKGKWKN